MPLKLARARQTMRRVLMPDTCTLIDAGAATQSDTGGLVPGTETQRTVRCGFIDVRLQSGNERFQDEVQATTRGSVRFRLPLGTVVSATTIVLFQGRRYEVVDPGQPDHSLSLAHYIGCEEITNG